MAQVVNSSEWFGNIDIWMKSQLDSGVLATSNKEHLARMLAEGISSRCEVHFSDANELGLTIKAAPSPQLMGTLRAMGYTGPE